MLLETLKLRTSPGAMSLSVTELTLAQVRLERVWVCRVGELMSGFICGVRVARFLVVGFVVTVVVLTMLDCICGRRYLDGGGIF